MLDKILECNSTTELLEICKLLSTKSKQRLLMKQVNDSGIVLYEADLYDDAFMEYSCPDESLDALLSQTAAVSPETKLVRRLQLIANIAPASKEFVKNFLQRSCV